jgi:hypothetical protein
MHQQIITNAQSVAIRAKLKIFGHVATGDVMTTIGKHPSLGSCIVFEYPSQASLLLSEILLARAGDMSSSRGALFS